jgi:PST family polysaccharide transporter
MLSKVIWLLAGRWVYNIITLISFFIIINEIGQASYGIYAIAAVFLIFIDMFFTDGIEAAIIRQKGNRDNVIKMALLVATVFSVLLALTIVVLAFLWKEIYSSTQIFDVVLSISLLVIFYGINAVFRGCLIRDNNTKSVSKIQSLACFIGALAGIAAAYQGFDYWSLIIQQTVFILISCSGLAMSARIKWKSIREPSVFKEVFRFAKYSFFTTVLNVFTNRLDILIIGSVFGLAQAGLYAFAKRIIQIVQDIFASAFDKVLVSMMRASKCGEDEKRSYELAMFGQSALLFPAFIGLAFLSDDFLSLFFNDVWVDSSTFLTCMIIGGVFRAMVTLERAKQVSSGVVKTLLKVRIQELLIAFIFFAPVYLLDNLSPIYIAIVFSVRQFIGYLLVIYSHSKGNFLSNLNCIKQTIIIPFIATLGMIMSMTVFSYLVHLNAWYNFTLLAIVGGGTYLIVMWFAKSYWFENYFGKEKGNI